MRHPKVRQLLQPKQDGVLGARTPERTGNGPSPSLSGAAGAALGGILITDEAEGDVALYEEGHDIMSF